MFDDLLEILLTEECKLKRVWFAVGQSAPPPLSYQVAFSRLDIVLHGNYINEIEDTEKTKSRVEIKTGEVLYIPPGCWNKPDWQHDCSVLSLLFGKRQLGFSLVTKREGQPGFIDVQKHSVNTRTGYAIDHILASLNSLAFEERKTPVEQHLLMALLTYCRLILTAPSVEHKVSDLYQSVCAYIQENYHRTLSRNNLARRFHVTPNHLSRLFRQHAHMTLADYITNVRIEQAKAMLIKYQVRFKDIADACGFSDVNYFYRVFKNKTGYTPSHYREIYSNELMKQYYLPEI